MTRSDLTNVLIFLAGSATGAGVAYLVLNKKLEAKYMELADKEVQAVRKKSEMLQKNANFVSPEELAREKYGDMVEKLKYTPERPAYQDIPEPADYLKELADAPEPKDPLLPHIITKSEYFHGDEGYDQQVLTFYAGDGVLANEYDHEMKNELDFIGPREDNLKFGHGSEDPNVVYIRCPQYDIDYEICRRHTKFGEEVAGFVDDELKHEDRPKVRKFRLDRE